MNKWLKKLTRKERIYLLAGAVVLFFGCVVYPSLKKAASVRAENLEEIEALQDLADGYRELLQSEDSLKKEHEELSVALNGLGNLVYRAESATALQTTLTQELGEMAPSLELQIASGAASRNSDSKRLDLRVTATGTYNRLLNFIYALETHEPMITIDSIDLNGARRTRPMPAASRLPQKGNPTEGTQPDLALTIKLHVNYSQEVAQ